MASTSFLPVHLLKERFRFYLHYKHNQVDTQEIRIDPELNFRENYKNLFLAHVKLTRCLSSRETVHALYADEDPGHATAIAHVQSALNKADDLLKKLCETPLPPSPPESNEEEKEDAKDNDEDAPRSAPPSTTTSANLTALKAEVVQECDELDRLASIADAKMLDVMARMQCIIRDDTKVSESMRHMVVQNTTPIENLRGIYVALTVLISKAAYGGTGATTKRPCYTSFFYHHDVTDDEIRKAIYQLQDMLVSKRELTQTLQKFHGLRPPRLAASAAGDLKPYMQFGLRLFNNLFCAAGYHTTEPSIKIVTTLTTIVSYIHNDLRYCSSPHDNISRRRLVAEHGEKNVCDIESTIHRLYGMYRNDSFQLAPCVPWTFILNCPNAIDLLILWATTILGQTGKQVFAM